MASEFQERLRQRVRDILADDAADAGDQLHRALRLLAQYRSNAIANTLLMRGGDRVRSGPFAGLAIPRQVAEGCRSPKLLGTYEQELHRVVGRIARGGYRTVVNIGAAEGYYAVGLALHLPNARILAFDTDENAQRLTRELAERHGVADRVTVGGEFAHADFDSLEPGSTFVFCDIEGAETDLLDPARAPSLARLDLLVELHNLPETPRYKRFLERFESSHRIEIIEPAARDISAFPELRDLEHLDQLLAFWEWRRGPTPWALLTSLSRE